MTRKSRTKGKVWRQVLGAVFVIGLLSVWIIGINRTANLRIEDIQVHIDQIEGEKNLLSVGDIERLIKEDLPNDITFQSITDIDVSMIEHMLNVDTRILNAEVYIDAKKELVIDIIQRRPILRVMNQHGDQFYVDQSGSYVRTVDKKATRVPVVTGYVESLDPDGHVGFKPRLQSAFQVIIESRKDPVLRALIEQVHVEENKRIVIIPKIGDDHIVLDHTDRLSEKLSGLRQFYRELARTDSWDKQDEIDISYNGMIVVRNSENL